MAKVHPLPECPPVPRKRVSKCERLMIAQTLAGSNMVMGCALILERMPDYEELSHLLEEVVTKHWRFRAVIQNDRWAAKEFKLQDHLIIPAELLNESFEDYVSREMTAVLDLSKILWQIRLVRRHANDRCLFLFKVHHIVCDAMALVQVVMADMAQQQPDQKNDVVTAAGTRVMQAKRRDCWWYLTWIVWIPFYAVAMCCMMCDRDIGLRSCRPLPAKGDVRCSWCWCCRRRKAPKKRCFMSPVYSLKDIRAVGRGAGSRSLTAMALSLVTGAVNDYGKDLGSTRAVDFKIVCPVTFRKKGAREVDNQSYGFVMKLPGAQDDDVRRLKSSISSMTSTKRSPAFFLTYVFVVISLTIMPASWFGVIQEYYASKCTFVLSSIPGPTAPINFAGVPLLAVYGFVPPIGDIPICLSMFTMDEKIFFGLQADETLSDPARIWKHYEARLGRLKESMGILE